MLNINPVGVMAINHIWVVATDLTDDVANSIFT